MYCPKCGAGSRWIIVDWEGDKEEVYCEMCGYGQDFGTFEQLEPAVYCLESSCPNPPMIARMPEQQSSRWLHKYCFSCACAFYRTFTPAQLAEAALIDFWKAVKEN